MKNPLPIVWEYVAEAWQGPDRKISYRRAAQFVFITLIAKIVKMGFTNAHQVYALLILCVTFLLLAAIIHFKDIVEALKATSSLKGMFKFTADSSNIPLNSQEKPE